MPVKNIKRMNLYICTISMIILTLISLSACSKKTDAVVIENNWKINLPEEMESVFHGSVPSFHGDGIRYTVFKTKIEPTDFLADFSSEKDMKFETIVNTKIAEAGFETPEIFLPNWGLEYYWEHLEKNLISDSDPISYFDNMYMIYFPDMFRLVICEDFI